MTRPIAFLKWCGGLAFLVTACASISTSASADSVYFGYSSGHYYRPGPAYYHHHHPYWGPYYGPRMVFVEPPPVIYAPPPRVVYAQPPAVYTPSAPLDATPASAPYRTSDGRYCREYQAQVMVNGAPQASYGTACRQPDGSWRVVN